MRWGFQDKTVWHDWFAWRPVKLHIFYCKDENKRWVWLETVRRSRRDSIFSSYYIYGEIR